MFVLDSPVSASQKADQITDFTQGEDQISLNGEGQKLQRWIAQEKTDEGVSTYLYKDAAKTTVFGVLDGFSGSLTEQDFVDEIQLNDIL